VPVHFEVQRNSKFNTTNTPIPFNLEMVNEGNAMNSTSGIFTAPRQGIYFFSFMGAVHLSSSSNSFLNSFLYLNGNLIGTSTVSEGNSAGGQFSPLTLQSTLNLKKGDEVWVGIEYLGTSSYLHDDSRHFTHFTGFMLEEEIVASL
jgi:hypothetical protein